ncbi:MAG TPA: PAS domain S-box protein, partial [Acidimicrobiales bacterium]|nr:PAS domain S-box protein [Acidimicrobiales bacterium]
MPRGERDRTPEYVVPAQEPWVKKVLGAASTALPVGLFVTDADGLCWYMNQRLADRLELGIYSPADRPVQLDVNNLNDPRLSGADGPILTDMEIVVVPVIQADKGTEAILGIVADRDEPVTAHLEGSQAILAALIERSPEIITILNADTSWRYSNMAASRRLGYQADFDPEGGILSLLHPDDRAEGSAMLARMRHRTPIDAPIELRLRSADGSWRYLENDIQDWTDDPAVNG